MTYNFDPDKWLENEQFRIQMQRASGTVSEDEAAAALQKADRRYEEMVQRLDGTFQVATPSVPPS